jgi:hypothetical protein
MPYPIPRFPKTNVVGGGAYFPGHLQSEIATLVEEDIHKPLIADVYNFPNRFEELVCKAVQQLYDMLRRSRETPRGGLNPHLLEVVLPKKVFRIALDCGWLPDNASVESPEWQGWIKQLLAGRFSQVGLGDSSIPDPHFRIPFPVAANSGKDVAAVQLTVGEPGSIPSESGDELRRVGTASENMPNRASWLKERLRERGWNKHDVFRQRGPHHKTVQKILDGKHVREDVLDKLANALSNVSDSKKLPNVTLLDIPQD